MKKLLKYISPLAPDDSGACSVLYELGGIVVICDAGGCTGNICGFDEPRWHIKKSALFSAGLRDMDAILGRDAKLVDKLADACTQLAAMQPQFTAIIGTPVPAVIATDLQAVKRMAEKKTGLPCIAVDTDGTGYYDSGAEKAYLALLREFAKEQYPAEQGRLGVLGVTPLDTGLTCAGRITGALRAEGREQIVCFGMDSTLDDIRRASACAELLVISPAGLKAAQYLHERFGTPYTVGCPLLPADTVRAASELRKKRVLIVHQQFAANALRERLTDCVCDCAAWFAFLPEYAQNGDFRIKGEDTMREASARYDVIIADRDLRRALPDFAGEWIDFPHYAVSARLSES